MCQLDRGEGVGWRIMVVRCNNDPGRGGWFGDGLWPERGAESGLGQAYFCPYDTRIDREDGATKSMIKVGDTWGVRGYENQDGQNELGFDMNKMLITQHLTSTCVFRQLG